MFCKLKSSPALLIMLSTKCYDVMIKIEVATRSNFNGFSTLVLSKLIIVKFELFPVLHRYMVTDLQVFA